ncbi:ferredoxin [Rhodococcus sp. NPDC003318]|uniref:ferredoxin n=1 Tax=Rhodococcus sp. NPDC003318 TaxID=3364503 RepID=UPI0036B9FD8A
MRIIVDESRCVGAGQCVLVSPDLFEQNDDDGTVIVLRPHPEGDAETAQAKEAVAVCPGRTLSLED